MRRPTRKTWLLCRLVIAAVVLGVACGCQQPEFPKAQAEAQNRWLNSRAQVAYRVGENRLASGQLDAALEAAEQALKIQPDYAEARLLAARVLIEQGRYATAIEHLQDLARTKADSSEVAYLLGVAQEKGGRLAEALASYRRAFALDESNLAAVKAVAEVLVAQGHLRQAELYAESYLPKAGEDAGMYELAGRLAAMNREYDKAAEHYRRARDLDYRNVGYLEALGRAQFAAGRYGQALDTLEELAGRKEYKTAAWLHMMLGDCYLGTGKASRAIEAFFTATELSPESPAAWTGLARSALAMNDTSRAIPAARKALQLRGDDLDARLVLGYALLRDGQPAPAVQTLTEAARLCPQDGLVQCLLGRAHAASGNLAEAARCYAAAARTDPASPLAKELLGRLGDGDISGAN